MGLAKTQFTVDKRANGYQGLMKGDRDHKKAMTLYDVMREKGVLCTEATKAAIKTWKKMELHRQGDIRDQRPGRGQVRKKLPGFSELFRFYSHSSCCGNIVLFLIF